jgi:NADH-quinone oxidoreductase subunit F
MNKILLCNCIADDPFAKISTYLLQTHQEEVLEGIQLRAAEIQAEEIRILLPEGFPMDSGREFAPGITFQSAKESMITINPYAAAEVIKGKLPRPTISEEPAILENHEIVMITPEQAYHAARNQAGKAPVKVIVLHYQGKTVTLESELNRTLSDVAASISEETSKGVLLGGIRGKFVKVSDLSGYQIQQDSLYDSLVFYGREVCMVDEIKHLAEQIQSTSCGKCVLCREGSLQYMTIVEDMTAGRAKMTDIDLIKEISPLIEIGAYCPFGQKMPGLLVTGLELFSDEFEAHIRKKNCPAGVCEAFASYCILPKVCTGCEDCLDACKEDAIEGKAGFIHMIDEDLCTKCGKCVPACDEGAIIRVTGAKPKVPQKLTKVGKF